MLQAYGARAMGLQLKSSAWINGELLVTGTISEAMSDEEVSQQGGFWSRLFSEGTAWRILFPCSLAQLRRPLIMGGRWVCFYDVLKTFRIEDQKQDDYRSYRTCVLAGRAHWALHHGHGFGRGRFQALYADMRHFFSGAVLYMVGTEH
jgi:hypothetical protein